MVLFPAVCEILWNWKGNDVCDLWSRTVHVMDPLLHNHVCAEVTADQKHGDGKVGDA